MKRRVLQKARSYQLVIEVPAEFHQKIIGPRGANINQLRDKHGVRINIPKGDERSNSITIVGRRQHIDIAQTCNFSNCGYRMKRAISEEE